MVLSVWNLLEAMSELMASGHHNRIWNSLMVSHPCCRHRKIFLIFKFSQLWCWDPTSDSECSSAFLWLYSLQWPEFPAYICLGHTLSTAGQVLPLPRGSAGCIFSSSLPHEGHSWPDLSIWVYMQGVGGIWTWGHFVQLDTESTGLLAVDTLPMVDFSPQLLGVKVPLSLCHGLKGNLETKVELYLSPMFIFFSQFL